MAFTQATPTDVEDAIDILLDFFDNQMSWTVDLVNSTVQMPGKAAVFELAATSYSHSYSSSWGSYEYDILQVNVTGVADPWSCSCNSLTPITRMFVMAGEAPEPWAHVVFESAPGYFHHVYLGYIEKYGTYDGGAIADATYWEFDISSISWGWSGSQNHMLFNGDTGSSDVAKGRVWGGIEVDHASAPGETYRFHYRGTGDPYIAGGGFGDAYNSMLSFVEPTGIEGNVVFHPVVLWADLAANKFVTRLGCVPGIRHINIGPFEPGQVISVGGKNWRVFPMCNKQNTWGVKPADIGPGNITPDSGGNYDYHMGGATEQMGIAILEE